MNFFLIIFFSYLLIIGSLFLYNIIKNNPSQSPLIPSSCKEIIYKRNRSLPNVSCPTTHPYKRGFGTINWCDNGEILPWKLKISKTIKTCNPDSVLSGIFCFSKCKPGFTTNGSLCKGKTCLSGDMSSNPWVSFYNFIQSESNKYIRNYISNPNSKFFNIDCFFQGAQLEDIKCEHAPYLLEDTLKINSKIVKWFNEKGYVPNVISLNNVNSDSEKLFGVLEENFNKNNKNKKYESIKHLPLNRYPFISSHDSATGSSNSIVPAVITQRLNFLDQYNKLVRFFDCRVDWGKNILIVETPPKLNNTLYLTHGQYGVKPFGKDLSLDRLIKTALSEKELIILHFCAYKSDKTNVISTIKKYIDALVPTVNQYELSSTVDLSKSYKYYQDSNKYILYFFGYELVDGTYIEQLTCFNKDIYKKEDTLPPVTY